MRLQVAKHVDALPQNDNCLTCHIFERQLGQPVPNELAPFAVVAICCGGNHRNSHCVFRRNINAWPPSDDSHEYPDFLTQFATSRNSSDRRQTAQQRECLILSTHLSKLMFRLAQRLGCELRKLRTNPEDKRGIDESGKGFGRQFVSPQSFPKFFLYLAWHFSYRLHPAFQWPGQEGKGEFQLRLNASATLPRK